MQRNLALENVCKKRSNKGTCSNASKMSTMANETVFAEPIAAICILGDERNHAVMEDAVMTATTAAAATTHKTPSSSSSSSSLRRLACDACRARKVRCDRQDPPCSRCAKMGVTCHYSGRSKPTPSKMDLSRFLITLNNRLSECELHRRCACACGTRLRRGVQNRQRLSWPRHI